MTREQMILSTLNEMERAIAHYIESHNHEKITEILNEIEGMITMANMLGYVIESEYDKWVGDDSNPDAMWIKKYTAIKDRR